MHGFALVFLEVAITHTKHHRLCIFIWCTFRIKRPAGFSVAKWAQGAVIDVVLLITLARTHAKFRAHVLIYSELVELVDFCGDVVGHLCLDVETPFIIKVLIFWVAISHDPVFLLRKGQYEVRANYQVAYCERNINSK